MIRRPAELRLLLASGLLLACSFANACRAAELPGYDATYRVEYKGIYAGDALFNLRFDTASQHYIFESRTRARGLAKLIPGGPAVERSEFSLQNGRIVPLRYALDDGTRKAERSQKVEFDWQRGVAVSSYGDATAEVPVKPGTLDRMTLQTAVMRDMALPDGPTEYLLVDRNELKRYRYEFEGTTNSETALGALLTKRYRQVRDGGSSRQLLIWVAPSLAYMPVRMEQQRNGTTQTIFTLEELAFHQ